MEIIGQHEIGFPLADTLVGCRTPRVMAGQGRECQRRGRPSLPAPPTRNREWRRARVDRLSASSPGHHLVVVGAARSTTPPRPGLPHVRLPPPAAEGMSAIAHRRQTTCLCGHPIRLNHCTAHLFAYPYRTSIGPGSEGGSTPAGRPAPDTLELQQKPLRRLAHPVA